MEQNIAKSKGCCPSVDRNGNSEEVFESNWTGEGDFLSAEDPWASRLRKRHRNQTGMRQCEDARVRKLSICLFVYLSEDVVYLSS